MRIFSKKVVRIRESESWVVYNRALNISTTMVDENILNRHEKENILTFIIYIAQ